MGFSIDSLGRLSPLPSSHAAKVNKGGSQVTDFQSELASASGSTRSVQIPSHTRRNGQAQAAAQNNNPGNLRFAHQTGATRGVGGFARFDTPEAGYQALVKQVQLDASRGQTVKQYISKFAPACENNTNLYIQQACKALGVDEKTPLASIDPHQMAVFQAQKESGTTVCQAPPVLTAQNALPQSPVQIQAAYKDQLSSYREASRTTLTHHVLDAYSQSSEASDDAFTRALKILKSFI